MAAARRSRRRPRLPCVFVLFLSRRPMLLPVATAGPAHPGAYLVGPGGYPPCPGSI